MLNIVHKHNTFGSISTNRLALKFNMSLHVNFEKPVDSTVTTVPPAVLVTEQFEVYGETDINELLRQCSSCGIIL